MSSKMTQKQKILMYIKIYGSITPMDAIYNFGITKLSTRISEMRRKDGIQFNVVMEEGVNRFEEPTRYARYSLAE